MLIFQGQTTRMKAEETGLQQKERTPQQEKGLELQKTHSIAEISLVLNRIAGSQEIIRNGGRTVTNNKDMHGVEVWAHKSYREGQQFQYTNGGEMRLSYLDNNKLLGENGPVLSFMLNGIENEDKTRYIYFVNPKIKTATSGTEFNGNGKIVITGKAEMDESKKLTNAKITIHGGKGENISVSAKYKDENGKNVTKEFEIQKDRIIALEGK